MSRHGVPSINLAKGKQPCLAWGIGPAIHGRSRCLRDPWPPTLWAAWRVRARPVRLVDRAHDAAGIAQTPVLAPPSLATGAAAKSLGPAARRRDVARLSCRAAA